MRLEEKYIKKKDNDAHPDAARTVLTDDAYAICEFIEKLVDKVEHARISLR